MKLASAIRLSLMVLMPIMVFSNAWVSNDSIGVYMKNYGELEIWGPVIPGDTTKQIDRITLLVGTDGPAVFDYYEDADVDVASMLVADPEFSDMEGFTSINNFYSFLPPDVHAAISIYTWNNTGYAIVSVVVTNIGDDPINARLGLDIISQIAGDYDGVHTWLPESNIVDMSREGENHIGLKFLSHEMTSLSQFIWFSGYSSAGTDADLWSWMNAEEIDTVAICTNPDDGVVSIPATDPIELAANESVELFYCVARGQSQADMVANVEAAETQYHSIFTVDVDEPAQTPFSFALAQNYPNPFNPSTQLSFSLPQAGHTTLNVFNLKGEFMLSLVEGQMAAGSHSVEFDASQLTSGLYIYTLSAGGEQISKKMTLLK